MYDLVIIGGGIIGLTTARMLSRYNLSILLLEKENDISEGATKANSGVLAAGFHPRGSSLKGISAVKGNRMYRKISRELKVPVKYTGSLMLAYSDEGVKKLNDKYKRGIINGAKGLRIIEPSEAFKIEPAISRKIVKALYSPETGIIDVFKLVYNSALLAIYNGVQIKLSTMVQDIICEDGHYHIKTNNGEFDTKFIVNAAGENADLIESYVCSSKFIIKPRRGQFYVFEKEDKPLIDHVIYQVQETDEKGCFIAPTIDGNLIAGPTSENVRDYDDKATSKDGLDKIERVSKKIIPSLQMSKLIHTFSGIRANISNLEKSEKDFFIERSNKGMISALGIKNPGITSAPYLSEIIIKKLSEDGMKLSEKKEYIRELKEDRKFLDCNDEEKKRLLKEDKDYAKVICRCEKVTLGDIKKVLRGPLPPVSLNGLKKRLRIGMGKCQGGFCTPELIEILSKEWHVSPDKILMSKEGSKVSKGFVK